MDKLSGRQILDAGLTDWRRLAQGLHARFSTGDMVAGVRFVEAVVRTAEDANHHPDVVLTYPAVQLTLLTHDPDNAVTQKDVDLARQISGIAREQGIESRPQTCTQVELALDTADHARIGPFWAAVLTGAADAFDAEHAEVSDPSGQTPLLWFQPTDPHEPPRQRFHLDVWVPDDAVEDRVRAALAAGGTEVFRTPTYVVLADAEDNKACICFSAERG